MDLSEYAGVFEDGYTDEDIDSVLPRLSDELGLTVVCVWDFVDEYGPGGDSQLCVDLDGEARELPHGLWELLVDSEVQDIAPIAGGPHPEIVLNALVDYEAGSGLGHQYHREWRNA